MRKHDRGEDAAAQTLDRALADEFAAIHGRKLAAVDAAAYRRAAAAAEQSALCLSGGGVRSAAFSLGVIQALAEARLLSRFDYLSTVSGGGFIGGFLSAVIRETGSVAEAEAMLARGEAAQAVRALRAYTNYLVPQGGLLSEDAWTGIVLYLRNVLINWFGFGPIFVLAVLAAIFYRTAIWSISKSDPAAAAALLIAAAGLIIGTWRACLDLPSHRPAHRGPFGKPAIDYLAVRQVRRWIVWPSLVWAFILPVPLAYWLQQDAAFGFGSQLWLPAIYAAAMLAGYWGAATRRREPQLYTHNFVAWLMATLASAMLLWLGLRLSRAVVPAERAEMLAVLGPLWLVLTNVLQASAHVALRREAKLGDLDREWLARLSAIKLRLAVGWTLFAFCSLSLQRVAFHAPGTAWPFFAVPVVTFASGPLAAWLGKQAVSRADALHATPRALAWLLPPLGLLFGAGLFTLLGYLLGETLGKIQAHVSTTPAGILCVQFVVAALLLGLICLAMRGIDVNRFSMHGVYRNRLTRAFLGPARAHRRADPFTGFDPEDNPRMADLADRDGPGKLFHVINVTLNLSTTTRTAWSERRAASFTVTPLACGSAALSPPGHSAADPSGGPAGCPTVGCYVPTRLYAGQERDIGHAAKGMTLATAMTISGAAVSPNMGYHSQPVTAFLMTLFNLRLGAWLPNPSVVTDKAELRRARPRGAFAPMLDELFGRASDRSRAIYLSDGGHFDDLGLYEMVRRRARLILVVDAGADPACQFGDLGAALRRIAIDQDISVAFETPCRIGGHDGPAADALDFAVATIIYPEGGRSGSLLYIKPCVLADAPMDVRAYAAVHPDFPHESTYDQFFTESQFESYRHLGQHQMRRLISRIPGDADGLPALFRAAAAAPDGAAPAPSPAAPARAAPALA